MGRSKLGQHDAPRNLLSRLELGNAELLQGFSQCLDLALDLFLCPLESLSQLALGAHNNAWFGRWVVHEGLG